MAKRIANTENSASKQNELNELLLNHEFCLDAEFDARYRRAKIVSEHYAAAENAVAVLSNMALNTSYICYGSLGQQLGIGSGCEEMPSIWENALLHRLHPDDVADKLAWELQFNSFITHQPAQERKHYYLQHFMRIRTHGGEYATLRHRIFYLHYDARGNVLLSLCLYTASAQNSGTTGIINSLTDTAVNHSDISMAGLLTKREIEILEPLSHGLASKQIAQALCISICTVNNHRQNIMRKLHCQNTTEAVMVAKRLGLLNSK